MSFVYIAIERQTNAPSKTEADKAFEISCNICTNRGINRNCETCPIKIKHDFVMECFRLIDEVTNDKLAKLMADIDKAKADARKFLIQLIKAEKHLTDAKAWVTLKLDLMFKLYPNAETLLPDQYERELTAWEKSFDTFDAIGKRMIDREETNVKLAKAQYELAKARLVFLKNKQREAVM